MAPNACASLPCRRLCSASVAALSPLLLLFVPPLPSPLSTASLLTLMLPCLSSAHPALLPPVLPPPPPCPRSHLPSLWHRLPPYLPSACHEHPLLPSLSMGGPHGSLQSSWRRLLPLDSSRSLAVPYRETVNPSPSAPHHLLTIFPACLTPPPSPSLAPPSFQPWLIPLALHNCRSLYRPLSSSPRKGRLSLFLSPFL